MKHSILSLHRAARLALCTALTLPLSVASFAHTVLKESTPADGAIVREALAHISLVFNEPVQLMKLELMAMDHEMPTNFESNSEAKAAFMIKTSAMHPGEFTVNWAVVGEDGHIVSNSYSFTVDPDAADEQAQVNAGQGGRDH